ncbi:universal stress protein [Thermodesulfobacterium sp. TA1]|uniref:universal stress protein n=1 Tax=Thermodesulfobacterium sp. TA1 TaxID=2234087 RepID=UPI00123229AC|nr:universal stress protein [Thermodesulfobacterium sp. TA1]QER41557.1 universal stress protein [Thermodesulfobacterium sp. TA1]
MFNEKKTEEKKDLSKIIPHVLLCYDGSPSSYRALSYLKQVFHQTEIDITILKLIEHPDIGSLQWETSLIKKFKKEEEIEKRAREVFLNAEKELKEVANSLEKYVKGKVSFKVQFRVGHLADDILRVARENLFDTIVVGRRGLSKLSTYFIGGVTHRLLERCCIPVWLIRGEQWNKKFLVGLDLGEMGLKVVDYVSFILSFHPEAEITFFHIFYPFSSNQTFEGSFVEALKKITHPEYQDFLVKANNLLVENGLDNKRVKLVMKRGLFGPAGEIIKMAKKEGYSNIVLGRRGRGGLTKLFLGSVSHKVATYFEDRAVWLVI